MMMLIRRWRRLAGWLGGVVPGRRLRYLVAIANVVTMHLGKWNPSQAMSISNDSPYRPSNGKVRVNSGLLIVHTD